MSQKSQTDGLIESQESSVSGLSQVSPSLPWWRQPERILAVSGAIGLRWFDKLGEEWTVAVLLGALGGPLFARLMRALRK